MRSSSVSSLSMPSGSSHWKAASLSILGSPSRFSAACDIASLPELLGAIIDCYAARQEWDRQTKTPPVRGGALHSGKLERSDRHLEFFGGAEGDLFARLDLDRLAGRGVAAHAGGAPAHLQDAEPGNLDPLALLEVLGDQTDEVFEHLLTLLLGHLVLLGQRVCQMFGGDRLALFWLRRSGCYR